MRFLVLVWICSFRVCIGFAQDSLWTLAVDVPQRPASIDNVKLLEIRGDSLKVSHGGDTIWVPVISISRISRGEENTWRGGLIGAVAGVDLGYTVGWLVDDSRRRDRGGSIGTEDSRLTFGVGGILVGGLLGGLLAARIGVDDISLAELTTGERLLVLEQILRREGGELPTGGVGRDIVYLTSGNSIRGTILDVSEFGGIKLRTEDSTILMLDPKNVRRFKEAKLPAGITEHDIGEKPVAQHGKLASPSVAMLFHAGITVPVGQFGATTGDKAGFAGVGYCFGATCLYDVTKDLSWQSDVTIGLNKSSGLGFADGSGGTYDPGSWLLLWILTGIGGSSRVSPDVSVRAMAEVGMLVAECPQISTADGIVFALPQKSASTAIAYSVGLGLRIAGDFVVDLKLSHATSKYEVRLTLPYNHDGPVSFEQPTTVAGITLGYTF